MVNRNEKTRRGAGKPARRREDRRTASGTRPATRTGSDRRRPGRSVAGPASARDRRRLRERNAAERTRVENVLAEGPPGLLVEGLSRFSSELTSEYVSETGASWAAPWEEGASPQLVDAALMATEWCPICGSEQIAADEVQQLGRLRLSECLRCDHRWTRRSGARFAEVGATMTRGRRREVSPRVLEDAPLH